MFAIAREGKGILAVKAFRLEVTCTCYLVRLARQCQPIRVNFHRGGIVFDINALGKATVRDKAHPFDWVGSIHV